MKENTYHNTPKRNWTDTIYDYNMNHKVVRKTKIRNPLILDNRLKLK